MHLSTVYSVDITQRKSLRKLGGKGWRWPKQCIHMSKCKNDKKVGWILNSHFCKSKIRQQIFILFQNIVHFFSRWTKDTCLFIFFLLPDLWMQPTAFSWPWEKDFPIQNPLYNILMDCCRYSFPLKKGKVQAQPQCHIVLNNCLHINVYLLSIND
jgi:hypothetical protein